jgi:tetratricopeptide (TPR) repeat protein
MQYTDLFKGIFGRLLSFFRKTLVLGNVLTYRTQRRKLRGRQYFLNGADSAAWRHFLRLGVPSFLPIILVSQMFSAYAVQAKKIEAAPQTPQASQSRPNESIAMLELAASVLEKKIQNGSAAALNQIASAFYTLGEYWEKKAKDATLQKTGSPSDENSQKAENFYQKAAAYFCKAAAAGCHEAVYNAGLALSKLQKFDEAANFYRQCIKKDEDSQLALKAAVNLAILILEKHVEKDNEELQQLVKIGQKNAGAKAETLLQTTVIILTDMNAESDINEGNADQSLQPKVLLTSETTAAPATP